MPIRTLLLGGAAVAAVIAISIAMTDSPPAVSVESQPIARDARVAVAPRPALPASTTDRLPGGLDPGGTYDAILTALQRDPMHGLAVLEHFLATVDPKSEAARTAVAALVGYGTPEAQQRLVRVLDARVTDTPMVKLIVPTLGFLLKPTEATEAAVRALTLDGAPPATRTTAHLTLGAIASRLDGPRGNAIVGDYVTKLASARSPEEQRAWLGVLGNAGSPAAAAAIAPLVTDRDPQIRARALEALRRVESAETDLTLTHALDDADPRVRGAAAWSLSYRKGTPETLAAMTRKLTGEADDKVAIALVDAIWTSRLTAPDAVMTTMRSVAASHPSEAIRKRARTLLEAV